MSAALSASVPFNVVLPVTVKLSAIVTSDVAFPIVTAMPVVSVASLRAPV